MFDLTAIRAQLPVLERSAYLNTGTAGPWPRVVVEAIEGALHHELTLGRASPAGLPDFRPLLVDTRALLAASIGAEADEIALTHSATEGIDIVAWGLRWQPGDEIVTTSIEHRGVLLPLRQVAHRHGAVLRIVDVGHGEPARTVPTIAAAFSPRTRLVAVSHVSFSTGALLDLAALAQLAHEHGAALVVDGAQAVGALPVDVHALGVDYYAFPGQKWLCGPEGTGGLYVARARQADLDSTYVGMRSSGQGAVRYEWATLFRPGVHGLHAALAWRTHLGVAAIHQRIAKLADYALAELERAVEGAVITPPDARAGLLHVRVPGDRLDACVADLAAEGVTVRSVPDTSTVRLSCGFFNTAGEIDRAIEGLARWAVAS